MSTRLADAAENLAVEGPSARLATPTSPLSTNAPRKEDP